MKLPEIMVQMLSRPPDETIAVAAKRMREKSVGCLVLTSTGAVRKESSPIDGLLRAARLVPVRHRFFHPAFG